MLLYVILAKNVVLCFTNFYNLFILLFDSLNLSLNSQLQIEFKAAYVIMCEALFYVFPVSRIILKYSWGLPQRFPFLCHISTAVTHMFSWSLNIKGFLGSHTRCPLTRL